MVDIQHYRRRRRRRRRRHTVNVKCKEITRLPNVVKFIHIKEVLHL